MDSLPRLLPRVHRLLAKSGPLLLLFQRAPVVRLLFPEARLIAGSGLMEVAGWTATAFAGLGAYDTVAGATTISQVTPVSNSLTVPAAVGSYLTFLCQVSGAPTVPGSWTVSEPLPPGLVHVTGKYKPTDLISGTPTQAGSFPVTVNAWEYSNFAGGTSAREFTIVVGPRIITTQPQPVMAASGSPAVLSVTGNPGNGTSLAYQWYRGVSPSTAEPVAGATSATYTASPVTASGSFWVRVTRTVGGAVVVANSDTAMVTVGVRPTIVAHPLPVTIDRGGTATLTVDAFGTSPLFQWYRGVTGDVVEPVAGATGASFTTPSLEETTSYWVRVSNSLGAADSAAAAVTVTVPDPFQDWLGSHFTPQDLGNPGVSGPEADPDGDGFRNADEYVLGNSPLSGDVAPLRLTVSPDKIDFAFPAKPPVGPGFRGMVRHYALETCQDLVSGTWISPSEYRDLIPGSDPEFTGSLPKAEGRSFYRLKVWLTP